MSGKQWKGAFQLTPRLTLAKLQALLVGTDTSLDSEANQKRKDLSVVHFNGTSKNAVRKTLQSLSRVEEVTYVKAARKVVKARKSSPQSPKTSTTSQPSPHQAPAVLPNSDLQSLISKYPSGDRTIEPQNAVQNSTSSISMQSLGVVDTERMGGEDSLRYNRVYRNAYFPLHHPSSGVAEIGTKTDPIPDSKAGVEIPEQSAKSDYLGTLFGPRVSIVAPDSARTARTSAPAAEDYINEAVNANESTHDLNRHDLDQNLDDVMSIPDAGPRLVANDTREAELDSASDSTQVGPLMLKKKNTLPQGTSKRDGRTPLLGTGNSKNPTESDSKQFEHYFNESLPENGRIRICNIRKIFPTAILPDEHLTSILHEVDITGTGSLNKTQFITLMTTITHRKNERDQKIITNKIQSELKRKGQDGQLHVGRKIQGHDVNTWYNGPYAQRQTGQLRDATRPQASAGSDLIVTSDFTNPTRGYESALPPTALPEAPRPPPSAKDPDNVVMSDYTNPTRGYEFPLTPTPLPEAPSRPPSARDPDDIRHPAKSISANKDTEVDRRPSTSTDDKMLTWDGDDNRKKAADGGVNGWAFNSAWGREKPEVTTPAPIMEGQSWLDLPADMRTLTSKKTASKAKEASNEAYDAMDVDIQSKHIVEDQSTPVDEHPTTEDKTHEEQVETDDRTEEDEDPEVLSVHDQLKQLQKTVQMLQKKEEKRKQKEQKRKIIEDAFVEESTQAALKLINTEADAKRQYLEDINAAYKRKRDAEEEDSDVSADDETAFPRMKRSRTNVAPPQQPPFQGDVPRSASPILYTAPSPTVNHSGDNNNSTATNTSAELQAITQPSDAMVRCEAQDASVVQETVHQREGEKVTPIINREREETTVNQVVEPVLDYDSAYPTSPPIAPQEIQQETATARR
ncbi:hypothetical protein HK097_008008 [Rhizophlyctis rosea]|uniref:EF-hand domain-containing protein n=1 Tax=Rhizophlyctis rosea TaxID=64517 RepID=A0AAD5SD47_9FUNG|nr:hypothetical protein HK097_008008 [Rhizophlyctis rosea]